MEGHLKLSKAIKLYLAAVEKHNEESEDGRYSMSPMHVEAALMEIGRSVRDALALPRAKAPNTP